MDNIVTYVLSEVSCFVHTERLVPCIMQVIFCAGSFYYNRISIIFNSSGFHKNCKDIITTENKNQKYYEKFKF